MSRILIAHASRFGRTCEIAASLAERLRARGHEVEIANAGSLPPPQDYDAVILGSRIGYGHHAQAIVDYVREHRTALAEMPTAFFSVSLAAAVPFAGLDPRGYMLKTFRDLGWLPDHAAAFGRIGTPQVGQLADLVAVELPERAQPETSAAYGPM